MKKGMRIIFLLLAVVMLGAFTFASAAAAEGAEEHSFVVEAMCEETGISHSGTAVVRDYYSLRAYSGRYGNQLSGTAKEVYDSLVKHYVTDGKTTTYEYTFKAPFEFKVEVLLNTVLPSAEFSDVKYEISCAMQMAQDAFLYDYPQLFWLRVFSYNYSVTTSGNTGVIKSISIIPYETYIGASEKVASYNAAVDEVLSAVTVSESRYDTLKALHDYICDNSWYNNSGSRVVYTSEPFFIGDGGMVCEGYSEAFKIICDRLGIPCVLVVGDAGGPHMWNYVELDDDNWYLFDLTWDDGDSGIDYTYFAADANKVGFDGVAIYKERTASGDFSETGIMNFVYPELCETGYGTSHIHKWNSTYTVDKAPTCTGKGSKSIHCSGCKKQKSVTEIPATNHPDKIKYKKQEATCTEAGYTEGYYCPDCKKWVSGHKKTELASHKLKTSVAATATLTENGRLSKKCTVCGYTESATVYRPKSVTLSAAEYTYNGKEKNPAVTVKDTKGKTLKNGTDYKLTYEKGRKNPGKYTVRVDFIGKYSGTKRLYFTIAPKATGEVKAVQSTKAIKLSWSKVTGADGYRVYQYNEKSKKWVSIKTTTASSYKVEELKAGTVYKFRIKAYKKDGGTIWGKSAPTFTAATKPNAPKITKLTASKGKAVLTWLDVSGESGYQVYYSTKKDSGFERVKTYKADVLNGSKSKLKSGKTYYFKVRAYKTVGESKIYSAWSAVKSVKVK